MLSLAQQFATLLDDTRFDEAAALMAEDCAYHYFEGNYAGRRNVINIYHQNHKASSEMFDEVRYSSEVEPLDTETYKVNLLDKIRVGAKWHEMHSHDILRIKDGLIVDIDHQEIPGEAEAFREFYQKAM